MSPRRSCLRPLRTYSALAFSTCRSLQVVRLTDEEHRCVEGFGKVSLREVEQKIKTETEDKFKLYNFLRPTKREAIQLRIEFLQETKNDIQKQIAAAERPARNNFAASQLKYETASRLVESAEKAVLNRGWRCPYPSLKDQSWPK